MNINSRCSLKCKKKFKPLKQISTLILEKKILKMLKEKFVGDANKRPHFAKKNYKPDLPMNQWLGLWLAIAAINNGKIEKLRKKLIIYSS